MSRFIKSIFCALPIAGLLIAVFTASEVVAGPPLICHPYEIGQAKTLPGIDSGRSETYDRKNLVPDVLALLRPETPVIMRMETLRRATLHATGNLRKWRNQGGGAYTTEDKELALALLQKLRKRSMEAPAQDRALALFDLGFYSESLSETEIDPALWGYDLLLKASKLRSNDPEIEFALAVASVRLNENERLQHLAKAKAAAKDNPLLAANLASHFSSMR